LCYCAERMRLIIKPKVHTVARNASVIMTHPPYSIGLDSFIIWDAANRIIPAHIAIFRLYILSSGTQTTFLSTYPRCIRPKRLYRRFVSDTRF
jgi:hypothetical protein